MGGILNWRFGYGGREVTYKGDPSVASVELGHAFREILARDCLEIVEAVTAGRRVADDVRSIASDHAGIPPGFIVKAGGGLGGVRLVGGRLLSGARGRGRRRRPARRLALFGASD